MGCQGCIWVVYMRHSIDPMSCHVPLGPIPAGCGGRRSRPLAPPGCREGFALRRHVHLRRLGRPFWPTRKKTIEKPSISIVFHRILGPRSCLKASKALGFADWKSLTTQLHAVQLGAVPGRALELSRQAVRSSGDAVEKMRWLELRLLLPEEKPLEMRDHFYKAGQARS